MTPQMQKKLIYTAFSKHYFYFEKPHMLRSIAPEETEMEEEVKEHHHLVMGKN